MNDSVFFKSMITEYNMDFNSLVENLRFDLTLLEQLYSGEFGNYIFSNEQLIELINQLNFLESTQIITVLIVLHFQNNQSESYLKVDFDGKTFNDDIVSVYNNLNMEDDIYRTFIKYNLLNPLKFFYMVYRITDFGEIYKFSLKFNNVKITQFLYENKINDRYIEFLKICETDNLEMAQWLHSLNEFDVHRFKNKAFYISCKHNKLNIAKWIYSLNPNSDFNLQSVFTSMCEINNLEISQWVYSLGGININEDCFDSLSRGGYLNFAKWIQSLDEFDLNNQENKMFYYAIIYGNLEFAQWLDDLYGIYIYDTESIFIDSCFGGHLNTAKWLYEIGDFENDLDEKKDDISITACRKNNIEIIKWVHNIYNDDINMDDMFLIACLNGYLEIAQWIYSLNYCNVNDIIVHAFSEAEKNGQLYIIKWLYSTGKIDINSDNNIDFNYSLRE